MAERTIVEVTIAETLRSEIEKKFTNEEIVRYLLVDMGFADAETLELSAGFTQYPVFNCDGEIFFIFENPVRIVGVSIPCKWLERILDLEDLQYFEEGVIGFTQGGDVWLYGNPGVAGAQAYGIVTNYYRCHHGHVLFLPIDIQNQAERIRLWCNHHEKEKTQNGKPIKMYGYKCLYSTMNTKVIINQ